MNVEFLRRLYLQEGETNMNSLKDNVAVVTDAMYVIVGGEREHRLDHRQFPAIEGREGARHGARRGATAALCAQRRGSVHGRT